MSGFDPDRQSSWPTGVDSENLKSSSGRFIMGLIRKSMECDGKMTTLLLVEDDAVLREGLKELFQREGYQVLTAGSIREAKPFSSASSALFS